MHEGVPTMPTLPQGRSSSSNHHQRVVPRKSEYRWTRRQMRGEALADCLQCQVQPSCPCCFSGVPACFEASMSSCAVSGVAEQIASQDCADRASQIPVIMRHHCLQVRKAALPLRWPVQACPWPCNNAQNELGWLKASVSLPSIRPPGQSLED